MASPLQAAVYCKPLEATVRSNGHAKFCKDLCARIYLAIASMLVFAQAENSTTARYCLYLEKEGVNVRGVKLHLRVSANLN